MLYTYIDVCTHKESTLELTFSICKTYRKQLWLELLISVIGKYAPNPCPVAAAIWFQFHPWSDKMIRTDLEGFVSAHDYSDCIFCLVS